ncbi:MAG: DUF177 domain-containing protein [Desulfovibrio sp.]|nr:DUF177 domain-containing protein [Desulfovibrio sp.]
MQNHRISLNNLPLEGREYIVDSTSVWQTPLREFRMNCQIEEPLHACIRVLPVENGWLVRGTLKGKVIVPCSRCAEDTVISIDTHFENFESLNEQSDDETLSSNDMDDGCIVMEGTTPLLDLAAICWQEFVLALPPTPLCRKDCKGLCARCGANLNTGPCACKNDEGDPRMAPLRGLILHNN